MSGYGPSASGGTALGFPLVGAAGFIPVYLSNGVSPAISPAFDAWWTDTSGATRVGGALMHGHGGSALADVTFTGLSGAGRKLKLVRQYVIAVASVPFHSSPEGDSTFTAYPVILARLATGSVITQNGTLAVSSRFVDASGVTVGSVYYADGQFDGVYIWGGAYAAMFAPEIGVEHLYTTPQGIAYWVYEVGLATWSAASAMSYLFTFGDPTFARLPQGATYASLPSLSCGCLATAPVIPALITRR